MTNWARKRRAAREDAAPDVLARLAKERDAAADERDDAADARDEAALQRRERAAARDVEASARDRRRRQAHNDIDPAFPDTFLSARDVDASAGDRADALDDERAAREDRQRAHEDRQRAHEDRQHAVDDRARATRAAERAETDAVGLREAREGRTVIGQAQGLLMARFGIDPDEAFALLVRDSQHLNVKLRDLAQSLVHDAAQQPRPSLADGPDQPPALGARRRAGGPAGSRHRPRRTQ